MKYGKTELKQQFPWGTFVRKGSKVLCSDGKVRSLSYIAQCADTFFSIPAAVKINGKSVKGYVTTAEQTYWEGKKTEPFLAAYTFRAVVGPRMTLLPAWPNRLEEPERFNALIASAH